MATPAMAPEPRKNGNGGLPAWFQQALLMFFVAVITWVIATIRADAAQEQRVTNIEIVLPTKANKEAVEELKREILARLDRIENKVDANGKRR